MANDNDKLDQIVAELSAIKRLLAHAMLQNGANQSDLAKALGINQSTVSRLFGAAQKSTTAKKARTRATQRKGGKAGPRG